MKREHDDVNGDNGLEALLRQVGAREEPSAAVMEEVRRAIHEEWRATVRQRRRRHAVVAFGIAACVALVAVIATWTLRYATTESEIAVTIARVGTDGRQPVSAAPGRTLEVGGTVPVGAVLITDDRTRIALAYGTGASMRIDRGSRIERVSNDHFRLGIGAVYVDAHPQARGHELVIETLAGEVRHLGTQYQIRQANDFVEVSIREGRVEIAHSDGAALASAGERLRLTADGEIERGAVSAQDPSWDWAEATSPPFAIHDRTLAEFLEWAARETGRQVAYASAQTQRAAENLKLRGSIEGLDPDSALSAVLATTEFTQYESGEHLIGVRLSSQAD